MENKEEDIRPRCKRCNRPLRSPVSIKQGYGQLCLKKHKLEKLKGWFNKK